MKFRLILITALMLSFSALCFAELDMTHCQIKAGLGFNDWKLSDEKESPYQFLFKYFDFDIVKGEVTLTKEGENRFLKLGTDGNEIKFQSKNFGGGKIAFVKNASGQISEFKDFDPFDGYSSISFTNVNGKCVPVLTASYNKNASLQLNKCKYYYEMDKTFNDLNAVKLKECSVMIEKTASRLSVLRESLDYLRKNNGERLRDNMYSLGGMDTTSGVQSLRDLGHLFDLHHVVKTYINGHCTVTPRAAYEDKDLWLTNPDKTSFNLKEAGESKGKSRAKTKSK